MIVEMDIHEKDEGEMLCLSLVLGLNDSDAKTFSMIFGPEHSNYEVATSLREMAMLIEADIETRVH